MQLEARQSPGGGGHLIAAENRTKSFSQWSKKGFIVPPIIDPPPVQRHSDLCGTWGMDSSLILLESQTGIGERQIERLEQPPDLSFQIVHQSFILHMVNAARQRLIKMIHQLQDRKSTRLNYSH